MKRFTEQLQKQASHLKLSAEERSMLRDRLVTYMEYHPLPSTMKQAAPAQAGKTSFFATYKTVFYRAAAPALTVFVMIAVPVLAERSNPGDVLYPVKVRFNEEVVSQLNNSPYEAIAWESERLERRIAEARLLASEGKLTGEVEAEVAAAVKAQSQKTRDKIEELRTTDADEAAIADINFATALEVQNEVLEADAAAGQSQGGVLASVVAEESAAADITGDAAEPSMEKLLARIESESTSATELFASVRADASSEEVADIERRLATIAEKVVQAQAPVPPESATAALVAETTGTTSVATTVSVTTSTTTDAPAIAAEAMKERINLLREALKDVRKLISFMTNIDVRASVTVDDLLSEAVEEVSGEDMAEGETPHTEPVDKATSTEQATTSDEVSTSEAEDLLRGVL